MITATQSKMARAALGWSIMELAEHAGIGKNTALRFEKNGNTTTDTIRAMEVVFKSAGITFPDANTVRHRNKD